MVRITERYPVRISVAIRHPRSKRQITAEMLDLSAGGCQIVSTDAFSVGDQILLRVGEIESWPGGVAWLGEGRVGVSFHTPLGHMIAEQYARTFRKLASP